jgi:hypothetical protein
MSALMQPASLLPRALSYHDGSDPQRTGSKEQVEASARAYVHPKPLPLCAQDVRHDRRK